MAITDGRFVIDGRSEFIVSADYPYYRDDVALWGLKLDRLKEMGVNVVTCYLPWRHHFPMSLQGTDDPADFTGRTAANRDVARFLALVHERGMLAVVKPGPWIHAETDYGGLPDYLADQDPTGRRTELRHGIAQEESADGKLRRWNGPMPSMADPRFQREVARYFARVEEVIAPLQYPAGPIIAVQLLNEGASGSASGNVRDFDYSKPSLTWWRAFARARGERGDAPRSLPPGAPLAGLGANLAWSEFSSHFYEKVLTRVRGHLPRVTVPVVTNVNLPNRLDLDSFLTRNRGRRKDDAAFGFTSWVGVLARDRARRNEYPRLYTVAGMRPGINWEGNWGFGKQYDVAYTKTQPGFFESLAYISLGARGINLYTGVATDAWDDSLDTIVYSRPYPDSPPIGADGSRGPKFATAAQLAGFMRAEGAALVESRAPAEVGYGLYYPYAHAAAWELSPDAWRERAVAAPPRAGTHAWDAVMQKANEHQVANAMIDVARRPLRTWRDTPALVMFGSQWMDRATASKVDAYVRGGGRLIWFGQVPTVDDRQRPLRTLIRGVFAGAAAGRPADPAAHPIDALGTPAVATGALEVDFDRAWSPVATRAGSRRARGAARPVGAGSVTYFPFLPFESDEQVDANSGFMRAVLDRALEGRVRAVRLAEPDPMLEVRARHDGRSGTTFVFALSYDAAPKRSSLEVRDAAGDAVPLALDLPASSGAAIALRGGRIQSALIKGVNDLDDSHVAPRLALAGERLAADLPCDLLWTRGADGVHALSVANIQGATRATVTLPLRGAGAVTVEAIGRDGARRAVPLGRAADGSPTLSAEDLAASGTTYAVRSPPADR